MSDFPESGIRLVADTESYTSAMQEALDLASQFDSLGDIEVNVSADTSEVAADISDSIPEDESVTVAADVTTSEESQSVLSQLHDIGDLAAHAWNLVVNLTGTAIDIFNKGESFFVQPILDAQQGMAEFGAQTGVTGQALTTVGQQIHDIFFSDLGTSVDQVTKVAVAAQQIGAPIDEASRAALTFTHAFTDQDPVAVLNTINQMVTAQLVPNFTAGADVLTVGFQNGANRAGDLLSALQQNSTAFKDLGLNGQESMSFITTGLDSGFTSATQIAQTLERLKTTITSAAGNPTAAASQTLAFLGIANPVDSGKGWSADFIQSVIDAIKASPADDATKQQMVANLFGGKLSSKEFSAIMGLDDTSALFDNVTGAAATAATDIDNSLSGAIADFELAVQGAATDFLSSKQIDLPGKIAALKTGIQDGLTALQQGDTLGQALTIALKPVGLDDTFKKLEQLFDTLVISLLQIVASFQDLTGHGDQAAATRATISDVAIDKLKLALEQSNNSADRVTAYKEALLNGVTGQGLKDALTGAVKDSLAEGNLTQAQGLTNTANLDPTMHNDLQMLVDTFKEQQAEAARASTFAQTNNANLAAQSSNAALMHGGDQVQPVTDQVSILTTKISDMTTPVTDLSTQTDTLSTNSTNAATNVNAVADEVGTFANTAADATQPVSDLSAATGNLAVNAPAAATAIDQITAAIQNAANVANAVQISQGNEALGMPDNGGANATGAVTATPTQSGGNGLRGLGASLFGYQPGAASGSGGGGSVNNVMNQINVQSMAQADALGYRTAQQLRGMA